MTVTEAQTPAESGPSGSDVVQAASIHVLMARVLADLPAVGKTSHNDDDGYSFRGIDDALNALNPILATHGVFYLPKVRKRRYEQRVTERGAVWYVVHLKVRFRFYGPNGDHVDAVVWGEGMDLGDKSTSKAHTAAQKVALVQAFSISTKEAAQNDADKTTPEETRGRPQAHSDTPPPEPDPLWKTIGWDSREELDEVYQPLLEMCRHLSPEVQADLKAWRTERSITLPPQKASFPELYAKVLHLTSPKPPVADQAPTEPPVAPAPAATNVAEKPPAVEAKAEPAPEAQAEPEPSPASTPAADPPPAGDADPLTKAQKDLAELQERAQAAASGKTPVEPAPDPTPPAPKAKPAKTAPKPAAAAPEPKPADPAAAEASAKPQAAAVATEAKKTDGDDEADPMACTARYDGCAGQIESPQQKDMSKYRWQKPMCKSCTKKTAQAAKHAGDPAPPAEEPAT